MKQVMFKGSGVAIVTPFTEDGVNFEKLGELIEFQISEKTDALIICGTTGEASTMPDSEHKETIKYTVEKVNGRIPVIAGTGSNDTKHCIELSKYAEDVGADGLLVVTPYYNKANRNGLIKHFTEVANAVTIPIMLYNVPSRTNLNIDPQMLKTLSEVENIVAIKEASGNLAQVSEMAALCGDKIALYSGNDDIILPVLSVGGLGVVSVAANIVPRTIHDLVMSFLNGDIEQSRNLQLKTLKLINALFIEVNPIPVKTALNLLGYNVGKLRMPLSEMSDNNLEYLKQTLGEYGFEV